MKRINCKTFILTAMTLLLTARGIAVTVAYSTDAAVDTRTLSRVSAVENKPLDSRSYTIDWSADSTLNTKPILTTLILLR